MAIPAPAIPNFNVQTPDVLGGQERAATLSALLNETALRKQLAPLQVQEQQQRVQAGDIENQLKTIQLQGQRALTDWLQNGDANQEVAPEKFSSNDKIATYVGVSPDDPIMSVVRSMAQHHVPAPMLMAEAQGMLQRRNEYYKGTKEEQDAQANERKIWQTTLAELHEADPEQRSVMLATKLPLLQENSKTDPLLGAYAKGLAGHPELIDQAYNVVSAENAALGLREAKAKAKEAEQKVIPEGGGLSQEAKQEVAKKEAEVPAEIKKETALAPVRAQAAAQAEIAKEKALAPELQQIASTTRSGRTYINRDDIPKGSEGVVEQQAAANGVRIVSKETAGTLTDIDEAKANMDTMLALVGKKLPTSPGERIYKGPENKLEAAMQTDPDLAAMGTFRNAAIKTMRAVAGSKGLRITGAEVQMAIDNDIPKMTDTWAVAQAKITQLKSFLENAESGELTLNRQKAAPAGTSQGHPFFQQFGGTVKQP